MMLSAVTQSSAKKTEGSSCGLLRGNVENYNKMWKEAPVVYLEGLWKTIEILRIINILSKIKNSYLPYTSQRH